MSRFIACTTCSADWQRFLAKPDKHWRDGYSAKALAERWDGYDGFPAELAQALDFCSDERLRDARPFYAVPEYATDLPGGARPSYTDLMVFGRARGGAFAMAVEGKVNESFGPTLRDWADGSEGKSERWSFICRTLGLSQDHDPVLRYQLFHRAASAVIAARQHHAQAAILAIHSFSQDHTGFTDFQAFCSLFGQAPERGVVVPLRPLGGATLYAGWVSGW